MIDIIWDHGANAPHWSAFFNAVAVTFATGALIWCLRQRRIAVTCGDTVVSEHLVLNDHPHPPHA